MPHIDAAGNRTTITGSSPAAIHTPFGMTRRPALSMVVLMVLLLPFILPLKYLLQFASQATWLRGSTG